MVIRSGGRPSQARMARAVRISRKAGGEEFVLVW
jgi:hypothetical protein